MQEQSLVGGLPAGTWLPGGRGREMAGEKPDWGAWELSQGSQFLLEPAANLQCGRSQAVRGRGCTRLEAEVVGAQLNRGWGGSPKSMLGDFKMREGEEGWAVLLDWL